MCFYLFINCVVILDIGGIVMHFRRGSLLYKLSLMLCAFSFYTASVCVCVCNPLSVSVCVCVLSGADCTRHVADVAGLNAAEVQQSLSSCRNHDMCVY